MKEWISYIKDEEGISTVEVLVIIAVLIAIAIVFKGQLITFVNGYMGKITTDSDKARTP